MNKPYFDTAHSRYLTMEVLRDIAQTIGFDKITHNNLTFGVNGENHFVVMIRSMAHNEEAKYVCVEYKGDGVCYIEPTDSDGNPINDKRDIDKLFDSHSDRRPSIQEAFHKRLRNKFDIVI